MPCSASVLLYVQKESVGRSVGACPHRSIFCKGGTNTGLLGKRTNNAYLISIMTWGLNCELCVVFYSMYVYAIYNSFFRLAAPSSLSGSLLPVSFAPTPLFPIKQARQTDLRKERTHGDSRRTDGRVRQVVAVSVAAVASKPAWRPTDGVRVRPHLHCPMKCQTI